MSERIVHPYLKEQYLDTFYVKGARPGHYFEGPIEGTIIRETPLNQIVFAQRPVGEQIDETIDNRISYYQEQLELFRSHGIRTVNPIYLVTEHEVADDNGFYRREPIVSFIADKIDGAIDFNDALTLANSDYAIAYNDLALRLLAMCTQELEKGNPVENELTRLPQYVIDPTAKTMNDMAVLVDVDPTMGREPARSAEESYATFLTDMAYDLVQLVNANSEEVARNMSAVGTLIGLIEQLPVLRPERDDIKIQVLEAIKNLDEKRLRALSFFDHEDEEEDI